MKQLPNVYIGMTLSSATMRAEDLIPTFMKFLQNVVGECEIQEEVDALQKDVEKLELVFHEGQNTSYHNKEQASWILDPDIWDLLNNIAPDYTYFGSQEGDGACYGFWTDDESLQDALMTIIVELEPQPELGDIREMAEGIINLLDVHDRYERR